MDDTGIEDGPTPEDLLAIFELLPEDRQQEIVELAKRAMAEPDPVAQAVMIQEAIASRGYGRPKDRAGASI
jgi:hypothetical protein